MRRAFDDFGRAPVLVFYTGIALSLASAISLGAAALRGEATMNELTSSAVLLLIASAAAVLWGYWYVDSHPTAGFGALLGMSDPVYTAAKFAIIIGVLAFILGIGLLIAGLNRAKAPLA